MKDGITGVGERGPPLAMDLCWSVPLAKATVVIQCFSWRAAIQDLNTQPQAYLPHTPSVRLLDVSVYFFLIFLQVMKSDE